MNGLVKKNLKESDEVRESDYGVNSTLLIAAHAEMERLARYNSAQE